MSIKKIPLEEYKKMWEDLKNKMRYTAPNIDPIEKTMTVQGQSGPGTPFKNEYERRMHEYHNPPLPSHINMWTEEDDMYVTYMPERTLK